MRIFLSCRRTEKKQIWLDDKKLAWKEAWHQVWRTEKKLIWVPSKVSTQNWLIIWFLFLFEIQMTLTDSN